jgi:hypothetical protein
MVGGPYPSVTVCCTPDEYDAENWEMIAELWNWTNARLIAAAPELLAALEMAHDEIDKHGLWVHFHEEQYDQIMQALAAAKPESAP